jgi:Ca2+-binding RTX toxin-like protein
MSDQVGNELDEFVTDTLRNNLLGLPLDLPTINMTRAREAGVPALNVLRRRVFNDTNDSQLKPYDSWIDFGLGLKHPESLINFVAAYGTHPSITSKTTLADKRAAAKLIVDPAIDADPADIPADSLDFLGSSGTWANNGTSSTTGLDDVDLWVGGLAEKTNLFGGLLGSTFNYVFENQLLDLQNGDRLYYLARTPGMNLRTQLEGNSFAEMVMRNTTAHTLKADAFATADCKFQVGRLTFGTGTIVNDDPLTECNERELLLRMPDGTVRYKERNTIDPPGINGQAVYNGTAGVDRIYGGVDNDTFLGNEGNDIIEGNDGADVALGGDGNDRITDLAGDDVPKGGPGNDAIDAGPGLDIVMGGEGKDFTNGGAYANETFGGEDDDFVIAGDGTDTVFGDSGDDWEEGGKGQDLLCGDSCAPFFDDPNKPGHDVLIGQDGEEDYDAEGGDDILIADAGIERNAGAGGFDWSTHERDTLAADSDLNLSLIGVPLPAGVFRDRYQEVEALSGGAKNDILRGDDVIPTQAGGAGFTGCDALDQAGLNRISGLDDLIPPLNTPLADVVANASVDKCPLTGPNVWGDGNVIIGGGGSDLIEGRGADDVIDGDKALRVRLSVRSAPTTLPELGSTDLMESVAKSGNFGPGTTGMTLQQAVFAGLVDPGNIVAVREITDGNVAGDIDTAVFSDVRANYTLTRDGAALVVNHTGGAATDGIDRLTNVERLRFTDQTIAIGAPAAPVIGAATAGNGQATVRWTPAGGSAVGITSFNVRVVRASAPPPCRSVPIAWWPTRTRPAWS